MGGRTSVIEQLHVFDRQARSAAAGTRDAPGDGSVEAGATEHFTVHYDPTLDTGATLAQAALATCEADYQALKDWFGGIDAGPFSIHLIHGGDGAFHAGCDKTALYCEVGEGRNADLVSMLIVAEEAEVFEDAQAKGWDCGASNGEGVSRVLAAQRYPAISPPPTTGWTATGRTG